MVFKEEFKNMGQEESTNQAQKGTSGGKSGTNSVN